MLEPHQEAEIGRNIDWQELLIQELQHTMLEMYQVSFDEMEVMDAIYRAKNKRPNAFKEEWKQDALAILQNKCSEKQSQKNIVSKLKGFKERIAGALQKKAPVLSRAVNFMCHPIESIRALRHTKREEKRLKKMKKFLYHLSDKAEEMQTTYRLLREQIEQGSSSIENVQEVITNHQSLLNDVEDAQERSIGALADLRKEVIKLESTLAQEREKETKAESRHFGFNDTVLEKTVAPNKPLDYEATLQKTTEVPEKSLPYEAYAKTVQSLEETQDQQEKTQVDVETFGLETVPVSETQHDVQSVQAQEMKTQDELMMETIEKKLGENFRIIEKIGEGNMGVVFKIEKKNKEKLELLSITEQRAFDEIPDGPLVLKWFKPPRGSRSTEAELLKERMRMLHEGKTMQLLSAQGGHQSIARTEHVFWDFHIEKGVSFGLIQEYIEGESFGDILSDNKQSAAEFLQSMTEVADALDHAHKKGVLHCDLKPDNVMRGKDGIAKVIDFGMARGHGLRDAYQSMFCEQSEVFIESSQSSRRVQTGKILKSQGFGVFESCGGTPYYMAPEQIDHMLNLGAKNESATAELVTDKADVYSLGAILYRAFTGQSVFRLSEGQEGPAALFHIMNYIRSGKIIEPKQHNQEISDDLNDLIMLLLSADPNQRPSAASARLALQNLVDQNIDVTLQSAVATASDTQTRVSEQTEMKSFTIQSDQREELNVTQTHDYAATTPSNTTRDQDMRFFKTPQSDDADYADENKEFTITK